MFRAGESVIMSAQTLGLWTEHEEVVKTSFSRYYATYFNISHSNREEEEGKKISRQMEQAPLKYTAMEKK